MSPEIDVVDLMAAHPSEPSDPDPASPDPEARRGRGRPRDPRTDARITAAAAELLLRQGFDRTTVDGWRRGRGSARPPFYRRWPSKEDLAVAAMESPYAQEFPEPDNGSVVSDHLHLSYRSLIAFVNTEDGAPTSG